jgi:hypothetical protein
MQPLHCRLSLTTASYGATLELSVRRFITKIVPYLYHILPRLDVAYAGTYFSFSLAPQELPSLDHYRHPLTTLIDTSLTFLKVNIWMIRWPRFSPRVRLLGFSRWIIEPKNECLIAVDEEY